MEELAEGKTPEDVTTEELKDIAPIATQEQFKKTYTENGKRNKWSFSDLAALAPFLDEDDLMEFASAAFEESGSLKEIAAIAPFLKEEDVARLAFIAAERGENPGGDRRRRALYGRSGRGETGARPLRKREFKGPCGDCSVYERKRRRRRGGRAEKKGLCAG